MDGAATLERVLAVAEDGEWRPGAIFASLAATDPAGLRAAMRTAPDRGYAVERKRVGGATWYRVTYTGRIARVIAPGAPQPRARPKPGAIGGPRLDFAGLLAAPAAPLLPLYEQPARLAVQGEEARPLEPECVRCELGNARRGRVRCMGASGARGEEGQGAPLYVLLDYPLTEERLPASTALGGRLRALVAAHWRGPVIYDHAVRCAPGAGQVGEKQIDACRGYRAAMLAAAAPARILAVGPAAVRALTGRALSLDGSRGAYAWAPLAHGHVPTYFVMGVGAASGRNPFLRAWFEADVGVALTATPPPPPWAGRVYVPETAAQVRAYLDDMAEAPWAAFDVETRGVMHDPSFRLLSIAFAACGSDDAVVVPGQLIALDDDVRAAVCAYLANPHARKVGQNVKYDLVACECALGVRVAGVIGDTRLWRKLLDPEAEAALDKMVEIVGMGGMKGEAGDARERAVAEVRRILMLERRAAKAGTAPHLTLEAAGVPAEIAALARDPDADAYKWSYALVAPDVLHRYNGRDAVGTARLADMMQARLAGDPDLARLAEEIVNPAARAVARVEAWGVPASVHAMNMLGVVLGTRMSEVQQALDYYAPGVNWASNPQVCDLLFNKLRLPVVSRTATGAPSVDADALDALRGVHPVVGALLQFRTFDKLRGTYAEGLRPHVRADGRIHPSIHLDGTRTGRASMSDPNLQNQPRAKDEIAKMVRDIFGPLDGADTMLVELDFSQVELRVAAMLSGDPVMRQIFTDGVDFHRRTAELVCDLAWGITPAQLTDEHRTQSKTMNFAVLYGMGDAALAAQMGCSQVQAVRVKGAILGKFKRLAVYCAERLAESRRTGEARTWWRGRPARRRPLWRIMERDDRVRSTAEHSSWNSPIQGTASDYLLASLVASVEWIERTGFPAKLCLPVHDSLLFEVKRAHADELIGEVRNIMTGWPADGVPLVVDAKKGDRWGSLEKVKVAA